ncbi:hypothetical protein FS837_013042 [Tulasnella sp. UAMH 9824]|nr:hypothetical protein FS837_013042 [Tulasnella sp. UAMH 9824]
MENLPIEILTIILLLATSPGQRRLRRRVSLVCRTWNTIISQNQTFWTEIGLHRGAKEFQQVLRRNTVGGLDISWVSRTPHKPLGSTEENLMQLASVESQRWRSLRLLGNLSDRIQTQFIQIPTPQLTDINICHMQLSGSNEVPEFRLTPEGYPLRSVVLGHVALDWDCSRMRGLRSLRIQGLRNNQPTLSQLHSIISSSPELEVLALTSWEAVGSAPTVQSLQPVALDFLKSLILDSIDPFVVEGVSLFVVAPNCNNLKIDWVRGNVAQDQSTALRFANLLRYPLKGASAVFLTYDQLRGEIILGKTDEEKKLGGLDIREATSKVAKRRRLHFRMSLARATANNEASTWNHFLRVVMRNVLQPVLSGLNIPVHFKLHSPRPHPPGASPNLAYDIFLDLPFINSLLLFDLPETISIVDYLASPQHLAQENGDTGPLDWPCSRLETLTVSCRKDGSIDLRHALDRLLSNRAGYQIEDQSGRSDQEVPKRCSRIAKWMKKVKFYFLKVLGLWTAGGSSLRGDDHDHLRGSEPEEHQRPSIAIEKIVVEGSDQVVDMAEVMEGS